MNLRAGLAYGAAGWIFDGAAKGTGGCARAAESLHYGRPLGERCARLGKLEVRSAESAQARQRKGRVGGCLVKGLGAIELYGDPDVADRGLCFVAQTADEPPVGGIEPHHNLHLVQQAGEALIGGQGYGFKNAAAYAVACKLGPAIPIFAAIPVAVAIAAPIAVAAAASQAQRLRAHPSAAPKPHPPAK